MWSGRQAAGWACRVGSRLRLWSCCCRAVTRDGDTVGAGVVGPVHVRGSGGSGGVGVRCDVLGAEVAVGVVGAERRSPAARGPRRRGDGGAGASRAVRVDDRIRSNGGRLHPDTNGLTIATFRQTTSRADDPQIHTHAVISAKVQTADGRWLALDARYLKRHQRMLGGLYQSVFRAELSHRLGVECDRSSTVRPRSPASPTSCSPCSPSAASTSTPRLPSSSTTFDSVKDAAVTVGTRCADS